MKFAYEPTWYSKSAGLSAWPKPGMSNATARPNSPTPSTSASKSRPEPGLPCTKTTASVASAGPASITGEPIPPTTILRARGTRAAYSLRGGARHALAQLVLQREAVELRRGVGVGDRHAQHVAAGAVVHLEAVVRERKRVGALTAVGGANARGLTEQ